MRAKDSDIDETAHPLAPDNCRTGRASQAAGGRARWHRAFRAQHAFREKRQSANRRVCRPHPLNRQSLKIWP
nr:hypothetical protein SHINE37_120334 [Rhizobiaceae bacterium]